MTIGKPGEVYSMFNKLSSFLSCALSQGYEFNLAYRHRGIVFLVDVPYIDGSFALVRRVAYSSKVYYDVDKHGVIISTPVLQCTLVSLSKETPIGKEIGTFLAEGKAPCLIVDYFLRSEVELFDLSTGKFHVPEEIFWDSELATKVKEWWFNV